MLFVGLAGLGVLFGVYLHILPMGRKLNARDPWQAGIGEAIDSQAEPESNPVSPGSPGSSMPPRPSKTKAKPDEEVIRPADMA